MADPTNRDGLPLSNLGVLVRVELPPEEQANFERSRAASVEIGKILERLDKYQKNLLQRLGVSSDLDDTEEFWVQLQAAARYVGLPDEKFWSLSFRETFALLEFKARELNLLAGVKDLVQPRQTAVPATKIKGPRGIKPDRSILPRSSSVTKQVAARALGRTVKTVERMLTDGRLIKAPGAKGVRVRVDEIHRILDSRGVRQTPKK